MAKIKDPGVLEVLKNEYESGDISIRKLAKQWDISTSTLQRYSAGWIKPQKGKVDVNANPVSAVTNLILENASEAIGEENKKKLVESGGEELFYATAIFFKNSSRVQKATHTNLVEHDRVMEEMLAGVDDSECKTIKERLDLQNQFLIVKEREFNTLLVSQRFIQAATKSATEMIMSVRGSLGLNNQAKDEKVGDTYNILITGKLKGALQRADEIADKAMPERTMEVEPL